MIGKESNSPNCKKGNNLRFPEMSPRLFRIPGYHTLYYVIVIEQGNKIMEVKVQFYETIGENSQNDQLSKHKCPGPTILHIIHQNCIINCIVIHKSIVVILSMKCVE